MGRKGMRTRHRGTGGLDDITLVMWGGKFSIENFPIRKIFRNIFPENFPFLKIIT
jgi:hypothetical protein